MTRLVDLGMALLAAALVVPSPVTAQPDPFQSVPAPQARPRPVEPAPSTPRQRASAPAPRAPDPGAAPQLSPPTDPPNGGIGPLGMLEQVFQADGMARLRNGFEMPMLGFLDGCWRSGPWPGNTGHREICFSLGGQITFASEFRPAESDQFESCPSWPGGLRLTSAGGGAVVLEAAQTTGAPCRNQLGGVDGPRQRLSCRAVPLRHDRFTCATRIFHRGRPNEVFWEGTHNYVRR